MAEFNGKLHDLKTSMLLRVDGNYPTVHIPSICKPRHTHCSTSHERIQRRNGHNTSGYAQYTRRAWKTCIIHVIVSVRGEGIHWPCSGMCWTCIVIRYTIVLRLTSCILLCRTLNIDWKHNTDTLSMYKAIYLNICPGLRMRLSDKLYRINSSRKHNRNHNHNHRSRNQGNYRVLCLALMNSHNRYRFTNRCF